MEESNKQPRRPYGVFHQIHNKVPLTVRHIRTLGFLCTITWQNSVDCESHLILEVLMCKEKFLRMNKPHYSGQML